MFRLLGFDVRVRIGFVLFLGLILMWYPGELGLWLAGGLAVFTLLHELGHAVAARSAGAHAAISLDFLAGYTSFRADPRRPLSPARRALISFAGPATQIAISTLVLFALGVAPWSLDSVRNGSLAAVAIWWTGPVIGMLNLLPVLPLDGGHLVVVAVERVVGDRAMRLMAIASLVLTIGGAIAVWVVWDQAFLIFLAFLVITQVQMIQATSNRGAGNRASGSDLQQRAAAAEAQAWRTGEPGMLEPGQRLSPWFEAHRAVRRGEPGVAMAAVLGDLRSTAAPRWSPPTAATRDQLQAVVDTLPAELPTAGNPVSAHVLGEVLLALGDSQRAGELAAAAFTRHRSSILAVSVARAAAAGGDVDNAARWIDAAVDASQGEGPAAPLAALATIIDGAPELAPLATDPRIAAARRRLG